MKNLFLFGIAALLLCACPKSQPPSPAKDPLEGLTAISGGGPEGSGVDPKLNLSQALATSIFVLSRALTTKDLAPNQSDSKSVALLRSALAAILPDATAGKAPSKPHITALKAALQANEKTARYATEIYFDARFAYLDIVNVLGLETRPKGIWHHRDETSKMLRFSSPQYDKPIYNFFSDPDYGVLAQKQSHFYILEVPKTFLAFRDIAIDPSNKEATSFDLDPVIYRYADKRGDAVQEGKMPYDRLASFGEIETNAIAAIVYTGTSAKLGTYSAYIRGEHGWTWARAGHPAEPVDFENVPPNSYFSAVIYESHPLESDWVTRRVLRLPGDKNIHLQLPNKNAELEFVAELPLPHTPTSQPVPSVMYILVVNDGAQFRVLTNSAVDNQFKITGSKENTHVFVEPKSASQFATINHEHAYVHSVAENDLAKEIVAAIAARRPDNILFFFMTHGAMGTGNICYKSRNECTFGANDIWDMLAKLKQEHGTKPPGKVLLVPLSCFNGILTNSLKALDATKGPLGFQVSVVHSTGLDAAGFEDIPVLMARQIVDYYGTLNADLPPFAEWVRTDGRLGTLQNLSTLAQWVQLSNAIRLSWRPDYAISHFSGAATGDVLLNDFRLRPALKVGTTPASSKLSGTDMTLQSLVNATFPPEMRSWVKTLEFSARMVGVKVRSTGKAD